MRCKPWRWLWGLLPLALLGYFMVLGERSKIEGDLTERARTVLDDRGFGWAQPRFDGRDAFIEGTAEKAGERTKALALVRDLYGVRVADDRSKVLDAVSPYTWTARLERTRLVLKGYVPNKALQRTIVGVARATFPGLEISDKLRFGGGAPREDSWLGAQSFALKQLAKLRKGRVELSDLSLTIEGVAKTGASYLSIKQSLKDDLPTGLELDADRTVPPKVSPYVFSAKYSEGRLELGGYLPNDVMQREIATAARDLFPGTNVVDRVGVGYGAPQGFDRAVILALRTLGKLQHGDAAFDDTELVFRGRTTTQELADELAASLRKGLPQGFNLREDIKFDKKRAPKVSPYVLSAVVRDKRIVLTGHVGSEEDRKNIVSAARERFEGFQIDDQLTLARTMPKQFVRAVRSALAGLFQLKDGTRSVSFSGTRLTFTGRTGNKNLPDIVRKAAARNMPGRYNMSFDIEVTEQPEPDLDWGGTYSTDKLVLEGEVPDAASRVALLAEAKRAFPGVRVVDDMTVRKGRADVWIVAARTALRQLGRLRNGSVVLSGQQLVLKGETYDKDLPDNVQANLRDDVPVPYRATATIVLKDRPVAEKKEPDLDWGAEYTGNRVLIEGEVPDANTRTALLKDAERTFPESQVLDRMTVKEGLSENWAVAASTALRQLGRLRKGTAVLSGQQVVVRGETYDAAVPKAVRLNLNEGVPRPYTGRADIAVKVDPKVVARQREDEEKEKAEAERRKREEEKRVASLEREREELEEKRLAALRAKEDAEKEREQLEAERKRLAAAQAAKPSGIYSWSATYDGKRVLIEGSVPSERDRKALIEDIRDQFPRAFISDKTAVRDDAPTNWLKAAKSTIGQLARLEKGKAEIRNREIDVTGEARNERNKETVEKGFDRERPDDFTARENVALVKPKVDADEVLKGKDNLKTGTCQAVIDDLLKQSIIRFNVGSAKIQRKTRPLLKNVATLMRRCKQARILITGHTDSDGGPRYNRRLSLRRARAVYRYLIRRKVRRRRMRIKGAGETKPVAPNDDRNNKALNRRIEFSLRG